MKSIVRILVLVLAALLLPCSITYGSNNKALLIGISQYADTDMNDLAYADEDVKTFASVLTGFANYAQSDIELLLNNKATKSNILSSFLNIVKYSQKNPIDNFVFMYAGHGLPSHIQSRKTNSFLAPYDAQLSQFFPEGAGGMLGNETFINKAWLVKQLSSINAKNIVIILDSCYSGAKDFGELYVENLGFKAEFLSAGSEKRGVVVVQKKGADGFVERRIAFLASSREDQPSAEYKELQHGALTYSIFEYLNAIRNETEDTEIKDITVGGIYSNITKMFDTVKVNGAPLSSIHQPVLFPIPDYDNIKDMRFVSVRGVKHIVKPPPPEAVAPKIEEDIKPHRIKTGKLDIITDPEKAEVYVDGVKTDKLSNCTLELTEGTHMIALFLPETNYNYSVLVDVKDGQHEKLTIALKGILKVESYAAKAGQKAPDLDVYVDGKYVGKTFLALKDIVAGTHTLKVNVDNITKERQIEIRPSSPLLVKYKVIREPAAPHKEDDSGVGDVTF